MYTALRHHNCVVQCNRVGAIKKVHNASRLRLAPNLVHRSIETRNVCKIRAVAQQSEVSAEVLSDDSSSSAFRKYFASIGWDKAWVDVVTDRLTRGKERTTTRDVAAKVEYLMSVGIPSQGICNMGAIAAEFLLADLRQVESVVEYVKRRGVEGEALVNLLEAYPKLLTFEVSYDRTKLEKGKARAEVDVLDIGTKKKAIVSFWREGASFKGAPVAPVMPLDAR